MSLTYLSFCFSLGPVKRRAMDERFCLKFLCIFTAGMGIFLFATASRPALWPTEPSVQCVPGALTLGAEGQGHEGDNSPPSNTEVNAGAGGLWLRSLKYVLLAWCSIKQWIRLYGVVLS
jgi:hypothetical protein